MASQSNLNQQQLTEQITPKQSSDEVSPNSPSNAKTTDLRILLTADSITASTESKHCKQDTEGSEINHRSYASTDSMSTSIFAHSYTQSNCTTVTVIDDCASTNSPRDNSLLTPSPINRQQAVRNNRYRYPTTFNKDTTVLSHIQHIPNAGHIMTQCPTEKNNEQSGTGSTGDNNGQNNGNGANDQNGNGWNKYGGSGGNNRAWNGRKGDDEKKRENDKNMDKYYDDIKDEEEEEKEDDDEFDAENDASFQFAPYIPLDHHCRSKSLNSSSSRDNKSSSARVDCPQYGYTLCLGIRKAQGFIKISKKLTECIIPNNTKEYILIENVYDFMDKTTGIALMDGHILHVGHSKILNYGFHACSSSSSSSSSSSCSMHGDELYLVADKRMNYKVPYVMRDALYTKQQICAMFNVKEYDLPRSFVDLIRHNVANDMAILSAAFANNASFCENVFTKWSKLPIFHGIKCKKDYNKRRITFSLTKPEFLCTVQSFVCDETSNLIPIVMFIGNRYRVEYLHIVKIEKEKSNIDIGISYVFDPYSNRLEATGIHLNKDSIIRQHQLIAPNHRCHCLDDFQCDIDDLHIGNPDDNKNRANALKNENACLKQKLREQNQKIKKLRIENIKLMRRSICWTQSAPLPTLSTSGVPTTPPTPHVMSPQSFSCFSPHSVAATVRSNQSPFSIVDGSLTPSRSAPDPYYTPQSTSRTTTWSLYQQFGNSPTMNQYNNINVCNVCGTAMIPMTYNHSGSLSSNGNVQGNNHYNASHKNRKNNTRTQQK